MSLMLHEGNRDARCKIPWKLTCVSLSPSVPQRQGSKRACDAILAAWVMSLDSSSAGRDLERVPSGYNCWLVPPRVTIASPSAF